MTAMKTCVLGRGLEVSALGLGSVFPPLDHLGSCVDSMPSQCTMMARSVNARATAQFGHHLGEHELAVGHAADPAG